MNLQEIKEAIDKGKTVHWGNDSYTVIKDRIGQYLIKHVNGHCIGLTWSDNVTLNGNESDFYISGQCPIVAGDKFTFKHPKYPNSRIVGKVFIAGKVTDKYIEEYGNHLSVRRYPIEYCTKYLN